MADRATADGSTLGAALQRGPAATREGHAAPRVACVLLIGEGRLADATERALRSRGAAVRRLDEPSDPEIREALDDQVDRVVVISRFDDVSLRRALVVAHVRPGISTLVTIFDRDVAAQLQDAVENVSVLSMADIVAPSFAGPCLDPELISLTRGPSGADGIGALDGKPHRVAPSWFRPGRARRLLAGLESLIQPFDASARILVAGLIGFLAVLVVETLVTVLASDESLVDALYSVAKVTVTVGPSPAADHGEDWFKLFSATTMLMTLGFAAVLTAGLVNRLLDPRLTGMAGRSAVPRRDHVVVVGLGQVGLRLSGLFRDLGVPVVAIELNRDANNVPRAKDQRLPVVIGSGSSQRLLRRLSIHRARALAAVTSDEVENIAIAVAARGVRDDLTIALRAGDGDATSETQSLFHIGVVRDVYRIAGTALAAATLGYEARGAFPHEGTLYLVAGDGEIEPFLAREGEESEPTGARAGG
ncbi:MAG: NAD-binding protein [Thermoleophilaceae bacterium]|nr:NAD-binding protein [Thermoleophilaceae bacterium]